MTTESGGPSTRPVLFWAFWSDDLSRALERHFRVVYLQHEAVPAPRINYDLPALLRAAGERADRPRVFFLHGWSLCDSLLGIENLGIPAVAYFHDTHFKLNSWAWDLSQSFDRVWLDTQESVEYFVRRGARNLILYCPLYYKGPRERIASFLPTRPRPLDVAFVGNWSEKLHPERRAFFENLRKRLNGRARFHFGPGNVEEIYSQAKIVINETVPPPPQSMASAVIDAPNFRVFEAMGCGALLLSDSPSPSVRALFEEGRDFVGYTHGDADEAIGKIEHHLDHEKERLAIAESGWKRVVEEHSPEARADAMAPFLTELAELGGSAPLADPERRFLLGRSLLRQALFWRVQAPSKGDPVFNERLAAATRLIADGFRSAEYGPMASGLIPLSSYLQCRIDEAIEGWRQLKGTDSHAYAGAFLAACAAERHELRKDVDAFERDPKAQVPPATAPEIEVFREILAGSVLQKPKA